MNDYRSKGVLVRDAPTIDGTFGCLTVTRTDGEIFVCETLELPWRDNARNISCIPTGVYRCAVAATSRFGMRYRVQDVPGRDGILIHPGNTAGDRTAGLESDVRGCILLGLSCGAVGRQRAVMHSKSACSRLESFLEKHPFDLDVCWSPGCSPE